jgi:hypothetical protein
MTYQEDLQDRQNQRMELIKQLQIERNSQIFILWNGDALDRKDFLVLSEMLEIEQPDRDIELFVCSGGGNGEAGYQIGRTFQNWAKQHNLAFRVVIPLYAKSAATILALGATELVMGLQSEIGPIDPQIPTYDPSIQDWRYTPAMSLIDGLKLISEYLDRIPAMSQLLIELMQRESLTLDRLGELERMRESGKQYAETLLRGGMMLEAQQARNIADQLSDHYKYHGHPIDAFEARDDLGLSVRYCEGEEWQKIRALGDRYDSLVEQEGLILNAVISTAIETANLTYQRLRSSQPAKGKIAQLGEEFYAKEIRSGKAQPKIVNFINTEGKAEVIINNKSSW